MKRTIFSLICGGILGAVLVLNACRKVDYRLPAYPAQFYVPAGWPAPQYDFTQNPLTDEGVELGRYLFYEGRLSKNGMHSCASCHEQSDAFTHEDHAYAHGFAGDTYRNPPGIFNMAWYSEYLQDGSQKKLEQVFIDHINSPIDMGESSASVIATLKEDATYRRLFRAAFGDPEINEERIGTALAQFVLTIISDNSKYDKVKRGEAVFSLSEQLGYDIFRNKCAGCHKEPLFTDMSYRNIGLPVDATRKDYGRMRVTGNRADSLKFRVLSLRNSQFTRPLGHDGRFFSFTNLYMHYNAGVVNGPTTDPGVVPSISLTAFEQGQLTSFLQTLTDSTLVINPKFRAP